MFKRKDLNRRKMKYVNGWSEGRKEEEGGIMRNGSERYE